MRWMPDLSARFRATLAAIDAQHAQDPRRVDCEDGSQVARELLYARRMSAQLERLEPAASELLLIAVRCQHLRRWELERASHAVGRQGYLRWRSQQALNAAQRAAELMAEQGYDSEACARVQQMVRKRGLSQDAEVQTLEDTACLVFLRYELEAFADRHSADAEKVVGIIAKTWNKMSATAHALALEIPLSPQCRALVLQAVGDGPDSGES